MTAIISGGVLSGVGFSDRYFGMSVNSSVEGYFAGANYGTLYRTQPNVRLVVDFLARNIGQVGLHFYRRVSDTDRTRITTEQPALLFTQPNPETTAYRLISGLVADLAIYGVGYWAKIGSKSLPGLARVQPWRMAPVGYPDAAPIAFRITGSTGGSMILPPEKVVYFRFYNPSSALWGLSPLESLRRLLAEEAAASEYRARFWRQGAKVSGFIERPKDAPRWSSGARDRFMSDWESRYTGEGTEVGGTPVLEDGMTYKEASFSARDSQYLEARKLAREEVAAAFHIPPPMVGILDNANYSNTRAFHAQLYQDTLGPWFEMLAQEVELQLVPDFDQSGDVYAEFNIADKLKGSFEELAAAMSLAVGGPWMTRAEARGRMNLPDLHDPAADELITPLNVAVGGQAAPNAPQPSSTPPGSPTPPSPGPGASAIQSIVVERAVGRLMHAIQTDGAVRRGARVLAESQEDLKALEAG